MDRYLLGLAYLAEALDAGLPELFVSYAEWVKVLFHNLRLPNKTMEDTLDFTKETIAEALGATAARAARHYLELASKKLLTRADSALYRAKDNGRNRVVVAA